MSEKAFDIKLYTEDELMDSFFKSIEVCKRMKEDKWKKEHQRMKIIEAKVFGSGVGTGGDCNDSDGEDEQRARNVMNEWKRLKANNVAAVKQRKQKDMMMQENHGTNQQHSNSTAAATATAAVEGNVHANIEKATEAIPKQKEVMHNVSTLTTNSAHTNATTTTTSATTVPSTSGKKLSNLCSNNKISGVVIIPEDQKTKTAQGNTIHNNINKNKNTNKDQSDDIQLRHKIHELFLQFPDKDKINMTEFRKDLETTYQIKLDKREMKIMRDCLVALWSGSDGTTAVATSTSMITEKNEDEDICINTDFDVDTNMDTNMNTNTDVNVNGDVNTSDITARTQSSTGTESRVGVTEAIEKSSFISQQPQQQPQPQPNESNETHQEHMSNSGSKPFINHVLFLDYAEKNAKAEAEAEAKAKKTKKTKTIFKDDLPGYKSNSDDDSDDNNNDSDSEFEINDDEMHIERESDSSDDSDEMDIESDSSDDEMDIEIDSSDDEGIVMMMENARKKRRKRGKRKKKKLQCTTKRRRSSTNSSSSSTMKKQRKTTRNESTSSRTASNSSSSSSRNNGKRDTNSPSQDAANNTELTEPSTVDFDPIGESDVNNNKTIEQESTTKKLPAKPISHVSGDVQIGSMVCKKIIHGIEVDKRIVGAIMSHVDKLSKSEGGKKRGKEHLMNKDDIQLKYKTEVIIASGSGLGLFLGYNQYARITYAIAFLRHHPTEVHLPAEKSGKIILGDELLSVNHIALHGMSFSDIKKKLGEVVRQGGTINIKFQKVEEQRRIIDKYVNSLSKEKDCSQESKEAEQSQKSVPAAVRTDMSHQLKNTELTRLKSKDENEKELIEAIENDIDSNDDKGRSVDGTLSKGRDFSQKGKDAKQLQKSIPVAVKTDMKCQFKDTEVTRLESKDANEKELLKAIANDISQNTGNDQSIDGALPLKDAGLKERKSDVHHQSSGKTDEPQSLNTTTRTEKKQSMDSQLEQWKPNYVDEIDLMKSVESNINKIQVDPMEANERNAVHESSHENIPSAPVPQKVAVKALLSNVNHSKVKKEKASMMKNHTNAGSVKSKTNGVNQFDKETLTNSVRSDVNATSKAGDSKVQRFQIKNTHKQGDRVMARSQLKKSKVWFKGLVRNYQTFPPRDNKYGTIRYYSIEFEDGTIDHEVHEVNVTKLEDFNISPEEILKFGITSKRDKSSNDKYARMRGWYVTESTGDTLFSSISDAIKVVKSM